MSDNTPIPWTAEDSPGAGWQIKGVLPKGFKFDGTCYGASGEKSFMTWSLTDQQTVLVACERWVQFETVQWKAMQAANAKLIIKAVNLHEELVASLEAMVEYWSDEFAEDFDVAAASKKRAIALLAKAKE